LLGGWTALSKQTLVTALLILLIEMVIIMNLNEVVCIAEVASDTVVQV
jgi:hypothetical protein